MTTPPRPTLDETLARIDAVLAEPERPPLVVHAAQLAAIPPATEDQLAAFRAINDAARRSFRARAIGWFRR